MIFTCIIFLAPKAAVKTIATTRPKPKQIVMQPDEPEAARRSPSPARSPVSNIIHVFNLVRPFTLGQLKALLGKHGKLLEDGFWIDKIKSHCLAKVTNMILIIYNNSFNSFIIF